MSQDEIVSRALRDLRERIAQENDAGKLRDLVIEINGLLDVIASQVTKLEGHQPNSKNWGAKNCTFLLCIITSVNWVCNLRPSARESFGINTLLSSLGQARRKVFFRKKQIIFSVGSLSDSILFIESGRVKLTITSAQGHEAVLNVLDRRHFFGEEALYFAPMSRTTNAFALTDVRATRIERGPMLDLLHRNGDVSGHVTSMLIRLIAHLTEELADNLLYASEQRLARALVSLREPCRDEEYGSVPNLSQQELGNMIGLTRQRVNTLMRRFRKLGFVDYNAGLRVHKSIREVAGKE
jgi:CRP/FNR family transcriptional regulator, cyclic AMP receptor protein